MENNTTPVTQPQDDMPTNKPATSLENILKLLPPNQAAWFLFLLAGAIVGFSLYTLTVGGCEGSLSLKGWGLEYQLTKKGSCSPTPTITQK